VGDRRDVAGGAPVELGDGGGVEVDAPPAGASLDVELDGLPGEALHGPSYRYSAGGAIEVDPLEPDDLPAAHPGVRSEVQCRVQALATGRGEEGGQLVGAPGPGWSGSRSASPPVGGVGDVVVEQSSLHRQIERGAHEHVDLEHGLGGEPVTVAAAGGGEAFVQVVEVVGVQPSQRNVPNGRCDVVLDEPGVSVGRGRSNLASLVRQPGRAQEVIEPERSASCGRGADGRPGAVLRAPRLRLGRIQSGASGAAPGR
jgi:hypothetical protein